MKIVIQNVVRDPSTHEIRRRHPGSVVPSPLIGGHRLPPRRSRTVETELLEDRDFLTLAEMVKCGVLRVFQAVPYRQLTEDELLGMVKCADAAPGPVVEAAPAEVPVSVADSVVTEIEAPVEPDPVASEEPSTIEASVTSSVKEELFELKNAELRAKLAELGGGNGTGLSKAQLVDAILERLA